MHITVYSKDNCPSCTKAKAWLEERGIPFTEVKYNDFADRQKFVYDRWGLEGDKATVPQILLLEDGEEFRIAGYEELTVSGIG